MNDEAYIDYLAGIGYRAYCKSVGYKSFNGQTLPTWDVLKTEKTKEHIVQAWIDATHAIHKESIQGT